MVLVHRSTGAASGRGERARPRDAGGLVAGLADPEPAVRRWSARDLAGFPEAVPALVDRLGRESDLGCRVAILGSLAAIGDAAAVAGLAGCLRSEDAALRNEAVEALKGLPMQAGPAVRDLLDDPDADVRILAVSVLESFRHPDAESWLARVVEQDGEVNVCAAAADLLAEIGTEASAGALAGLRERFPDQPYLRFAVDLALKRIREG